VQPTQPSALQTLDTQLQQKQIQKEYISHDVLSNKRAQKSKLNNSFGANLQYIQEQGMVCLFVCGIMTH
jgi:hypothetical protein